MEEIDANEHGLISADGNADDFDLLRVSISCAIKHLTANVTTTCTYKNTRNHTVDAKYVFPLNNVAVYCFEARIGDERIVAQCRPREEAKATYDEALASGHTTFAAEQDERCDDIFQIRIGNIPSLSTVMIVLKYIGEIEAEIVEIDKRLHSKILFTLPGVLSPRYTPPTPKVKDANSNGSINGGICPYKITFSAAIMMPLRILNVSSIHDMYDVEWTSFDHKKAQVKLCSEFQADHDLQMVILTEGALNSFACTELGNKLEKSILSMGCIMAQFMPNFSAISKSKDTKSEMIFIVDRSSKMTGENIKFAAESLLLFLKGLPKGCRFQIISYGDMHQSLFPEPVEYNITNLNKAMEFQRSLKADLGGTEMLPALNEAFRSPLPGNDWCKKIILLTTGIVSNGEEIVGLIRSNVSMARVFSVGIGTGLAAYLLSSVAHAGQGITAFIRHNNQLRPATMKVLEAAMQPRATNVQISWDVHVKNAYGDITPVDVTVVPEKNPPIFKNCFTTVFGLFDASNLTKRRTLGGQVRLECDVLGQRQTLIADIPDVQESRLLSATVDFPLHRLAGKLQLADLCDQQRMLLVTGSAGQADQEEDALVEDLRARIEQLSCAINVISPRTAFIGVDPVKHKPIQFAPPPPVPIFNLRAAPRVFAVSYKMRSVDMDQPDIPSNAAFFDAGSQSTFARTLAHNGYDQDQFRDIVFELIELQTPEGSWLLNEDLARTMDLPLSVMQSVLPLSWSTSDALPVDETIWATFLVLAYLEVLFAHRREEWDMYASKSHDWLDEKTAETNLDADVLLRDCYHLFDEARKLIESQQAIREEQEAMENNEQDGQAVETQAKLLEPEEEIEDDEGEETRLKC